MGITSSGLAEEYHSSAKSSSSPSRLVKKENGRGDANARKEAMHADSSSTSYPWEEEEEEVSLPFIKETGEDSSSGTRMHSSLKDRVRDKSLPLMIQTSTSFESKYKRLALIGQGGHGKVYQCSSLLPLHDNDDEGKEEGSCLYAVKDIDLNRLSLVKGFDKSRVRREVEILMNVSHANILACRECFGRET